MLEFFLGEASCATIQRPKCRRTQMRGSFRRRCGRTNEIQVRWWGRPGKGLRRRRAPGSRARRV